MGQPILGWHSHTFPRKNVGLSRIPAFNGYAMGDELHIEPSAPRIALGNSRDEGAGSNPYAA